MQYFNAESIETIDFHPYAIFNLSRIYYFGIDIEPNIAKSIELLKKLSKNNFKEAANFLNFIQMDENKKEIYNEYKNNLQNNILNVVISAMYDMISFINDFNNNICDIMLLFYKKHDLVYSDNDNFQNVNFHIHHPNKKNLAKNINNDFYEGFYNE